MAQARKNFTPKKNAVADNAVYADFIDRLGKGEIAAVKLVETRTGNGRLKLEYDDPNG